jgi:pyrroloquinoline quinone biosynthesis protein E
VNNTLFSNGTMLISEEEFQSKYGSQYKQLLIEINDYLSNPGKLKDEVDLSKKNVDSFQLQGPVPDQYSYRMMLYRGFDKYPDRMRNYIIAQNETKAIIRSHIPTTIDVEPASRCNYRCIMCSVSERDGGKRADDLTFENFKNFMEKCTQIVEVKIQGMGEPLLNKHLFDMIQLAVERYVWVRTTVNGSLLHVRDKARRLIDSGVGEVQCSFDGATKEVFEKIRLNSNFEKVVQNYTMLNSYANKLDRPYTRLWVLVQKHNRHQILQFVELAKRMEFRRLTLTMSLGDWGEDRWNENNKTLQPQNLNDDELKQLIEINDSEDIEVTLWGAANKCSYKSLESLCPMPFNRAFISSDYRISPCGNLGNPEVMDLGDASDFKKAWNGPNYREFRQAHLNGNIPKCCQNCYKEFMV